MTHDELDMIFIKLWEEEELSDGAVEDLVVICLSSEMSAAIPSVEHNFLCLYCDTKVLLHQREELAMLLLSVRVVVLRKIQSEVNKPPSTHPCHMPVRTLEGEGDVKSINQAEWPQVACNSGCEYI